MNLTNRLLVVGGLLTSYALVSIDTIGASRMDTGRISSKPTQGTTTAVQIPFVANGSASSAPTPP